MDTGTASSGNDRGAPCLQEEDDDDHDQRDRFQQRMDDGLDRGADELRGVVDDVVFDIVGHVHLDLFHHRADVVGDLDGVRARSLEDGNGDGRLVVQQRPQRIIRRAQLDPGDVAQPHDLAVRAGLHDDLAELLLIGEAALGVDRELEIEAFDARRGADDAGGGLHVLGADFVDDVARRQAVFGHLLRVEPDAHGIIARAEQLDVADAVARGPAGP